MLYNFNQRYKNITQNQVCLFLRCCEVCQQKKCGAKKSVVVKPMVFKNFNSRCRLDLIDMQAQADGDNKFIFVYQDHLTKFIILKPPTSKRGSEVAYQLLDVFSTI